MEIAFISYWSCPLTRLGVLSSGGMNVYVLNLANNLGMLGHKVDIYTKTHKENDETILKTHKNVRIIHLLAAKDNLYEDMDPYSQRVLKFIENNKLRYDILHSHYFYSGLIGLKLKNKLSVSLVATFHALGTNKDLFVGIRDQRRIDAEREIVQSTDGIISSVELERAELVKNYAGKDEKIFTVPPGVNHRMFRKIDKNLARKRAGMPKSQKIVLFVGRIDPIKGIRLLIEAVSKLSKTYINFKNNFQVLLIGGDIESHMFWRHPEVIKIQLLIEKLDLACCVKFVGSKPHHLLPYYYSGSDVVVMPSKYESFGLVVLEAMACGAAVVASKVGGLSFLIKDRENGRFFTSGDVNDLGEVIWELLNDDKERERLGRQAILESKKFCWDKQARRIVKIYESLK